MTKPTRSSVTNNEVYAWICANTGVDAEDVAKHFRLGLIAAVEITEALLRDGRVEPCYSSTVDLRAKTTKIHTQKE